MICPECDGEFVESVRRCPDCEVDLVAPEAERPRRPAAETGLSGEAVVVLRTGRLVEADMAALALEEAGVPHYRREQSSSGPSFAMPAAPSSGPGVLWVIRVPEEAAERARSILEELPMEIADSPGVWDFGPTDEAKSIHRRWAMVTLVLMGAAFLMGILSMLRRLLGG